MSTFLALIKVNLNTNFGISALKYRYTKEKKKRWEPILIALSIIFGFGPLIVMYTFLVRGLFNAGLSMGQPEIVLTLALVFAQFIVLIFGIFYIMSTFYFSKDLTILIPMPIGPYQVLGSKFVIITINEYLTVMPILIPPVIIYGAGMKMGILYWIKALFVILAVPVIPLVMSSIVIVILMRFINIRKSKDLLAILGGLLMFILVMVFNVFMQRLPQNIEGNEIEFFNNLMTSQYGMIKEIGRKFPPSVWATLGLSEPGVTGWGYLLLFLSISVLMFIILLWIGNKVFYMGVISGQEVTRKRKTMSQNEVDSRYKKTFSPVTAIFWREWKILLRTPVYVLNGLIGTLIGPIMLLIMLASASQGPASEMGDMLSILRNPELSTYVSLGVLALMLLTAGMNAVPSTSLSREGSTFWISKLMPVSPTHQVLGKFLHGLALAFLGILTTGIMMAILLKYPTIIIAILIVLGILGAIPLVAINLMVDVIRPKLVWNSPQEAMKQNFNSAIGMLGSIIIIALLGGLALWTLTLGFPDWAIYLILGAAMIVLSISSIMLLFKLAEKKYVRHEI